MPDVDAIRWWWFERQGLAGKLARKPVADVLSATGWVHTAGGQLSYIAIHARSGAGRALVDESVASGAVHEVPAARGCTMLVPAADAALALRAGQAHHEASEVAIARRHCGVTDKELAKLGDGILAALARGPLEPKELHDVLGDKVRNLGEVGKKRGMTTTLPVALGTLQARGEVRRISTTGHLDNQRYRYALWRPNPLAKIQITDGELHRELARRFFRWAGPATIKDFAWWAGIGQKDAKSAAVAVGIAPVADGDDRVLLAEDLAAFKKAKPPAAPLVALVPFRDNAVSLRRDLRDLFDRSHAKRKVQDWVRGEVELGQAASLHQPAILERGRLVGFWDYDADAREVVTRTLEKATPAVKKGLDEAVARLLPLVRDELGDAKFYSLDTDKNRRARIAMLRGMK